MRESKEAKKRRLKDSNRKRLETIRKRHGADWTRLNAIKAGKLSGGKFNSETGRQAAIKKHEQIRAAREKGLNDGSN